QRHHRRHRPGHRRAVPVRRADPRARTGNARAGREALHPALVHRRRGQHVGRRGEGRLFVHGGAADLPRDLRRTGRGRRLPLVENRMSAGRMEAFSDGVIAVIITIMVLELKVPHGADAAALAPLATTFLTYVLSFIYT